MGLQIRGIRLRNVRSYEAADVALEPGTTLFVGDVGSGKTSLLHAIEMGLFGFAEVDPALLVRHGATAAEVAVTFADSEHRYEITRRFRRVQRKGRETFELERGTFSADGGTTAYPQTELRRRVIDLLGFPDNPNPRSRSDLWRWAVYVSQERMRDVLSQTADDRLATVRKALGVEQYRIAAENAGELASDLRLRARLREHEAQGLAHWTEELARATEARTALEEVREELTTRSTDANDRLKRAEVEVSAAETTLRALEADRREERSLADLQEEVASELRDLRTQRENRQDEAGRAEEFRARLAASDATVAATRAQLADAEAMRLQATAALEASAARTRAALEQRARAETARERHEGLRRQFASASQEVARTVEGLTALDAEAPTREPTPPTKLDLTTIDDRLARGREQEGNAKIALDAARRDLVEITELLDGGTCPRCGQAVNPRTFTSHRVEAQERVRGAEAAALAAEEERRRLETERASRERYDRALERWREKLRRRADLEMRRRDADGRARELEAAAHQAKEALRSLGPEAIDLGAAESEEATARARMRSTEERRDLVAQRLEAAGQERESVRAATQSAETARAAVDRLDGEIRTRDRRFSERAAALESIHERLARSEEVIARARGVRAIRDAAQEERERAVAALAENAARREAAALRIQEARAGDADRGRRLAEAGRLTGLAEWTSGPFRDALLTIERRILESAQAEFDRSLGRYFAALVEDPAMVARTGDAFEPAVSLDGVWTPAEALSGGERTSLALAFRLALSRIVRSMGGLRLDLLLLDEPTDGFSPEQVVRMGDLLDELALPQVVIVSHEAALARVADRVIRVRKQDGRSSLETDTPLETDEGRRPEGASPPGPDARVAATLPRTTLDVPLDAE